MTAQEFKKALESGNTKVTFTDIDGKTYIHTILKAGKIQVNLFNDFLNKEYKLNFKNNSNYPSYKLS